MAPPKREQDLAAELELIDLRAIADRAENEVWRRALEHVDERRLTADRAAEVLGVATSTLWRRAAAWGLDTGNRMAR